MPRYTAALLAEIHRAEPFSAPLDAVSVGGGTPSGLAPDSLAAVLRGLAERFGLAPGAEVSLEANPEDWSPALAEALVAAGYSRVSLGAQSFDPGVLAALGGSTGRGRRPGRWPPPAGRASVRSASTSSTAPRGSREHPGRPR